MGQVWPLGPPAAVSDIRDDAAAGPDLRCGEDQVVGTSRGGDLLAPRPGGAIGLARLEVALLGHEEALRAEGLGQAQVAQPLADRLGGAAAEQRCDVDPGVEGGEVAGSGDGRDPLAEAGSFGVRVELEIPVGLVRVPDGLTPGGLAADRVDMGRAADDDRSAPRRATGRRPRQERRRRRRCRSSRRRSPTRSGGCCRTSIRRRRLLAWRSSSWSSFDGRASAGPRPGSKVLSSRLLAPRWMRSGRQSRIGLGLQVAEHEEFVAALIDDRRVPVRGGEAHDRGVAERGLDGAPAGPGSSVPGPADVAVGAQQEVRDLELGRLGSVSWSAVRPSRTALSRARRRR